MSMELVILVVSYTLCPGEVKLVLVFLQFKARVSCFSVNIKSSNIRKDVAFPSSRLLSFPSKFSTLFYVSEAFTDQSSCLTLVFLRDPHTEQGTAGTLQLSTA